MNRILKGTFDRNEQTANGVRRWWILFDTGALSTVQAFDTEQFETTWITPENEYFNLQSSENEIEAFTAHVFWAKKIEDGFVPSHSLFDNFSLKACIKFLENLKNRPPTSSDK